MNTFKENKSSGDDGLTIEFYKFFWDKINTSLLSSFNESFQKGELSSSQNVLPSIIHKSQSVFVKGRKIEFALRTIQHIINSSKDKLFLYLLFIDFEMAFDSLKWNFMLKCLEIFNFGPDLIKWIQTFYKNVSSCIINNGTTGQYFQIGKGVRQGDPWSPYFFIICIELLAIAIRSNKTLKVYM